MGFKRDEMLYTLLWAGEILLRPTFRNLTESFESWAERNRVIRQLQRLEKRRLIERLPDRRGERLHRLTERGRLHALGGRDPETFWNRPWDGLWRLAIFDVPEVRSASRDRLRRYLQRCGFGYLQNSVWITPDPAQEQQALLAGSPVDVESLIFLEARPCSGETDVEIARGAWDFAAINACYARYRKVLASCPRHRLGSKVNTTVQRRWVQQERQAWLKAVEIDPLLPSCLLPPEYAGRVAWRERMLVSTPGGRKR